MGASGMRLSVRIHCLPYACMRCIYVLRVPPPTLHKDILFRFALTRRQYIYAPAAAFKDALPVRFQSLDECAPKKTPAAQQNTSEVQTLT